MRRDHERTALQNVKGIDIIYFRLTNGKGNPSLRIMEWIADALDKPLPELLEGTGLDSKSLEAIAGGKLRGNSRRLCVRIFNAPVSSSPHRQIMDKGCHGANEEIKSRKTKKT